MSDERWTRIKALFHAALERAPDERQAFLAEAFGVEEELRAEVDRLLAAHADAGNFIERSPAVVEAARASPALTGRVVGHYEVGQLLGVGGVGEVYAARDIELKRRVALKVVPGGDWQEQLELRQEAQLASQLNHPHICTIHEVGSAEGQTYFVMEYVDGEPLSDAIAKGKLATADAVRYGIQIADAVAHAHRHGVIHGDLKSANVVLTANGHAKVLDFGLARQMSSEQVHELSQSRESWTEGPAAGTLPYMAPELLRGERADRLTDQWALGVVLYEMTAGRRPFDGGTPFELSAAILKEAPRPLPARVPRSLQDIVQRCLAKDRHARYADVDELRAALGTTPVRRRTTAAVLALIGVLATAAAGGILFSRGWHAPLSQSVALGAGGRPAIAVMSFENMTDAADLAWLSRGVPNMLLTGLAQTQGLDLVSEQRLHQEMERMGISSLESMSRSQIADLARRVGAGAVVEGTVVTTGGEIRIDAHVEDLTTGRVLVAESVHGHDMFALVDRLAARIREGLGFRGADGIRSIADVSTPSIDAYRLYAQGTDAQLQWRLDEADDVLKKAVAIDPDFAEAYMGLASVAARRGRVVERREYLRAAAKRSVRLSERHRLFLDCLIARDEVRLADAARLIVAFLNKFPDSEDGYEFAGSLQELGDQPVLDEKTALAIVKTGATRLPQSSSMRTGYGYALLNAGRYNDAIGELEAAMHLAPREPNSYDSLGDAHLALGEAEKALDYYSRAQTLDPSFSQPTHFTQAKRVLSMAVLGQYDRAVEERTTTVVRVFVLTRLGRFREAADALAGQVKASKNNPYFWGMARLMSAVLAIERSQDARAIQEAEHGRQFLEAIKPPRFHAEFMALSDLLIGVAHVRSGRVADARAQVEMLRREQSLPLGEHWARALEGEIALAEGDLEGAKSAFAAGEPPRKLGYEANAQDLIENTLPTRDGLARVAKARGDVSGAIQEYRRLLSSGNEHHWVSMFEPRYVMEIARLLDQSGDKKAAKQEYERFREFWKNADGDLPELTEARQAVTRISRD